MPLYKEPAKKKKGNPGKIELGATDEERYGSDMGVSLANNKKKKYYPTLHLDGTKEEVCPEEAVGTIKTMSIEVEVIKATKKVTKSGKRHDTELKVRSVTV